MKRTLFLLVIGWLTATGCGARARSMALQTADSTAVTFYLHFKADNAVRLDLLPLGERNFAASSKLDSSAREHQVTLKLPETRDAFSAFITAADGSVSSARIPYGDYRLGQEHSFKLEPSLPQIQAGKQASLIQQRRLEVPSGQYSGITHVEDDYYAVVHDKKGSIFYFTLGFLGDGTIGPVQAFEASPGKAEILDNEDIVYVPETKTLFVSAEADQSIREYDLSGKESGRKLHIPDDLSSCAPNAGFESLAYSSGTFWTTTEAPLPEEILPRLHRIQCFTLQDLSPSGRYLYQADAPAISGADAAGAMAYVHGISAMTALPDGRLLVLEREVYVPGGGFLEKLGAFSEIKLYAVSPADDPSGILQKTRILRFRTSALNLANYEGMCLGPVLEDGRQCLLLLADSQDGSGGLTGEYLQVIAL